ncbi:unnamed protein product [Closterium sp. NIES-54]
MKLLRQRGLTRALLLLGSPLHSSASAGSTSAAAVSASSTPPATATTASTSTAATEAPTSATTPTPTRSTASTATTAAPTTSSSSLAPLALADAASLTRSRRSADQLGANKVDSSSRGNRGQERNKGAPLKERGNLRHLAHPHPHHRLHPRSHRRHLHLRHHRHRPPHLLRLCRRRLHLGRPARRFLRATAAAATAATATTVTATAATAATTAAPLSCSYVLRRYGFSSLDRYSSPATAALGRLLLPYLFPELSAFATVKDLVSHLRASDARYRAALPEEFLDKNPPPMYITLYFIVTHLPDSLRSVRDHFLSLDPTSLTVDLLEQNLLVGKTSAVAVGAARGTPRTPFFEGCPPSPLAPSYASAAAVDILSTEDLGAASASGKRRRSKGKGGRVGGGGNGSGGGGSRGGNGSGGSGGTGEGSGGVGGGGGGSGGSGGNGSGGSGGGRTGAQRGGSGGGQRQRQQSRSETPSPQQLHEWLFQRGVSRDSVSCPYVIRTGDRAGQTCGKAHTQHRCFSRLHDAWRAGLDYDAMYAFSASAEGDCYRCVPPDPGIDAAALGARESVLPGTAPVEALHTFTLDSNSSRRFFRDSTTLTPLRAPVPVRLADPSGGLVVARSSTVLPCPAVPSGSLSGLHLPSFSTNLVSTAALQDAMVTTTTPGGQRVSICTCTRTGRHMATFTCRPVSSLYTLATEPPHVPASAQVSASGQVAPPCSCRLLSHQTLLWHHRLGHPSLPCLRGMHSRLLVSGLPRSLPPLPPSPAPPCLPCVEGRQCAAPHSSSFPPTTAPLQTLHMDVWGPARVSGQGRERYFLLVVDDYTRYTTVFPLRSKGQGGEFSSDLLRDFCRGEGILQSFTLPDSPKQNGIAERRIGLVMEVARTSMIHAAAPHFLCPFVVWYAAHQLNLWPRVSLPETSSTLRWTGQVGNASMFRVWGSRAFVRDTSADKLTARAIPCVFLGFPPDTPGWQFYHPTSRRVFPSQDVMLTSRFPFTGPAPSGVSQIDPLPSTAPIEVADGSGAAPGAESGGAEAGVAESEGVGSGGAEPGGEELGGAEPVGVEPRGAESEGVEPGGAESEGAECGGAEPQGAALSVATGAGGAGVTAGAGGTGGTAATDPGAGDPTEPGAAGAGGSGAGGAGVGGAGAGGAGVGGTGAGGAGAGGIDVGGAGVGGTGAGGAGAGGAGVVDPGGTVRPRPYFVPLLQQVLPLLYPPPDQSQLPFQPASPLHAPSPYTEQTGGLTERCKPASCPISPVRSARRVPRLRPPPVPSTHAMALRPSSVPLHVPLPAPPESSLPEVPDSESDRACATSPTVSRLLATVVNDPSFESNVASSLVAELVEFATACRLDYATTPVAESSSASPPSVGGECALGTDVLEDRKEDFECLATAVPCFASMLLAPEGDPDAPDIPTPRSYAEAIMGPYSSQWQAAMDAEMAS